MKSVLVISPHPDDESLGCGGTLRKHVMAGDSVRIIFLTSGENGGHGQPPQETARIREAEACKAAAVLGVEQFEFWRECDGGLRATRRVVRRLEESLVEWKPDLIYVSSDTDMHPDHRAATRIVRQALAAPAVSDGATECLMFEVWTPLEKIDHVVDISEFIENKIEAIRAHKSQCQVLRFDDAFVGLARYRGEMHSWPGGEYAEIFSRMPR